MYIPSYIEKIDAVMSCISDDIRVVFLQSEYPNILDLVLNRKKGSTSLREWLRIQDKDFVSEKDASEDTSVTGKNSARMLTANLQSYSPYYILKDGKYYKNQLNLMSKEDPVDDACHFFYLTHADALGSNSVASMLQAFLENRIYPNETKLILTGSSFCIPDSLAAQVQLIRLGSPTLRDIEEKLKEKRIDLTVSEQSFDDEKIKQCARELKGLTYLQLQNVFAKFGVDLFEELTENNASEILAEAAWEQKHQESEKDSTLVYSRIKENPGVVGLTGVSDWINDNLPFLADPEIADSIGIKPPRGLIIAGVPGTGKTQLAKQLVYRWSRYGKKDEKNVKPNDEQNIKPISLIELKIGNLSSKNYGESEQRITHFLKRCEENAPAVLIIDEVDKLFADDEKNGTHEVKRNQLNILLGWLQESKANIFVFMTANKTNMPSELLRSGRLSAQFFVFMPSYIELMCMLYSYLHGMIPEYDVGKHNNSKEEIFDKDFIDDIRDTYNAIDNYEKKYGTIEQPDLSDVINRCLLTNIDSDNDDGPKDILTELTKYAMGKDAFEKIKNDPNAKIEPNTDRPMSTPFMTGADMKELLRSTMVCLYHKDQKKSWSADEFGKAMIECCCCPKFRPYGQANIKTMVEIYLNCDFRDTSADPLLPKDRFNAQTGKFVMKGNYIYGTSPEYPYDRYMQQTLVREIEQGEKLLDRKRHKLQDEIQKLQMDRMKREEEDRPAREKDEKIARELHEIQYEEYKAKRR